MTGDWKNQDPVAGDNPRLGVIVQSVVGESLWVTAFQGTVGTTRSSSPSPVTSSIIGADRCDCGTLMGVSMRSNPGLPPYQANVVRGLHAPSAAHSLMLRRTVRPVPTPVL